MTIELTPEEIATLLTSLDYSKDRVRNAQDTPAEIRRENLDRLDAVSAKLRRAHQAASA